MEKNKLEFLLKRAEELENYRKKKKTINIYMNNDKLELTFEQLPHSELLDITEEYNLTSPKDSMNFFKELIYKSCKELRDEELINELGVKDPMDVVLKIFSPEEIAEMAMELQKCYETPEIFLKK